MRSKYFPVSLSSEKSEIDHEVYYIEGGRAVTVLVEVMVVGVSWVVAAM